MQPVYDTIYHFLGTDQHFTIPIFQRKYDWDKTQCQQLFDDIIMVGQSSVETHFLGSVVHIDDTFNIIPTYRVIDGQQRLTTLTLLLCALAKFLKENPIEDLDLTSEKLINKYLINRDEEGDLKYKIRLNGHDNETLHYIIDYTISEQEMYISSPNESKNIRSNFKYFLNRINKDNAKTLFDGFLKLYLIVIKLEHSDNPQLIFESLNYKGLSLSKSDLIRNYVLMGLKPEEQDTIYKNYWSEMEELFKNIDYKFDKFIKDYLTTKEGRIPVEKDLYNEFRWYAQEFFSKQPTTNKFENIKLLAKDIYKYFKYFEKFFVGEEKDDDLRLAFKNVYEFGQKIINPFFLHLYDDYDKGLLSSSELLEIVDLTESYLFRRNVCNLNNQRLKTIFAKAYDNLDKDYYTESYKELLLKEEGETIFPNNREFGDNFIKHNFYKNKSIAKYALGKLENFGHEKEAISIENFTIEHIMPQNPDLSEEWQEELGYDWKDVQEKYLHTIGNLTLTGYNQKYSDLPFKTKRDMENGYKDSPIRLNKAIAELNTWNENQITKRASDLRKQAQKIWIYPKVQKHLR